MDAAASDDFGRSRVTRLARAARIVHPFPSFLAAATATALVPIADSASPPSRYLAIGFGLLAYQFCIGATNDVVDVESDRLAKPWKPIAAGAIGVRTAGVAAGVFCMVGIGITSVLSPLAWVLGLACLGCGVAYDFVFKRTVLSWLPYAIAFSLLPVWVFVACDAWSAPLWWVFPIGGLFGLALHLSNQAPDIENSGGDFLGLPQILGRAGSLVTAVVLFAIGVGVGTVVLAVIEGEAAWLLAGVGVVAVGSSPFAMRSSRETALFGVIAIGCAAAAIVFLAAIP